MISTEEFGMWKRHEVTKELHVVLTKLKEDVEEQMLNEAILLSDRCQIELARLVGLREGIDLVLNLDAESIVDEEED